jgi:hypothetical protein
MTEGVTASETVRVSKLINEGNISVSGHTSAKTFIVVPNI